MSRKIIYVPVVDVHADTLSEGIGLKNHNESFKKMGEIFKRITENQFDINVLEATKMVLDELNDNELIWLLANGVSQYAKAMIAEKTDSMFKEFLERLKDISPDE
jgi:hypothetical protein